MSEPAFAGRLQGAVARLRGAAAPLQGAAARLRGAAAQRLGRLPAAVQARLAGRAPICVDGQTLDPTLQLFLRLRPDNGPRPLSGGTPEQARLRYRREVLSLRARPAPAGDVRDLEIAGAAGSLRARHYAPPGVAGTASVGRTATGPTSGDAALLVYYHGGGFLIGDLDTHDEACRVICRHAGQHVLSVAYRLAPEHPFPAPLADAEAAFRWAQAHAADFGVPAGRVAVGGDSAGGNLAAAVAQRTAGTDPPLAQLLIYPLTDRSTRHRSTDLFDGYFLSVADSETFSDCHHRATGTSDADPGVSPLLASCLGGLPPALVVTAGFDILRDEGEAYARALQQAGTRCVWYREPSLAHGFIQLTAASRACHNATVRLAREWQAFTAPSA